MPSRPSERRSSGYGVCRSAQSNTSLGASLRLIKTEAHTRSQMTCRANLTSEVSRSGVQANIAMWRHTNSQPQSLGIGCAAAARCEGKWRAHGFDITEIPCKPGGWNVYEGKTGSKKNIGAVAEEHVVVCRACKDVPRRTNPGSKSGCVAHYIGRVKCRVHGARMMSTATPVCFSQTRQAKEDQVRRGQRNFEKETWK